MQPQTTNFHFTLPSDVTDLSNLMMYSGARNACHWIVFSPTARVGRPSHGVSKSFMFFFCGTLQSVRQSADSQLSPAALSLSLSCQRLCNWKKKDETKWKDGRTFYTIFNVRFSQRIERKRFCRNFNGRTQIPCHKGWYERHKTLLHIINSFNAK